MPIWRRFSFWVLMPGSTALLTALVLRPVLWSKSVEGARHNVLGRLVAHQMLWLAFISLVLHLLITVCRDRGIFGFSAKYTVQDSAIAILVVDGMVLALLYLVAFQAWTYH